MHSTEMVSPTRYDRGRLERLLTTWTDVPMESGGREPEHPMTRDEFPYMGRRSFSVHRRILHDRLAGAREVLEVGPGCGNHTLAIGRRDRRITVGDISAVQLEAHRQRVGSTPAESGIAARVVLDVADLPFLDNSFDATLALGGPLSYVFDQAATGVRELLRVTRPGGRVVVSVMSPGWITSPHMGYADLFGTAAALHEAVRTGDVDPPGTAFTGHRFRCYTWGRLAALMPHQGCTILDRLASHVDGIDQRLPLTEYMEIARRPVHLDSTRGYLIAVLEKQ